jgi:23S rRNA (uracil1939-C5)-methyltransferase
MIVTIEKLVFGGQGLARLEDGQVVFVWNALPGEEVEIEIIKKKKGIIEAVATKIIKASPERVEPREKLFLSSSPWQMMAEDREDYYKQAIAVEQYGKIGGLILSGNPPKIDSVDNHYGYRNKIEFSFAPVDPNQDYQNSPEYEPVSLAFFERGQHVKSPVEGAELAEPIINELGKKILDWVNEKKIPMRSLKSLIIRSNGAKQGIAAIFLKDKLKFDSYPELSENFLGFQVYFSTHKSPASVPTELLYADGQDYLIADIKGTKLKFGLLSFFQINIPIFEKALDDISAFLPPKQPVIDFYAGVGAISLPLSYNREETIIVDSNKEAIEYAEENVSLNELQNCKATCLPAEEMTDVITKDKVLIVDPPRAGMHPKVISRILIRKPPRIIYLSCNIATQARDIKYLEEEYKITFMKLYNFFPRTPHIEGLVVLDRI